MRDGTGRETRGHGGSRRRTGMIAALLLAVVGSGSVAVSNQGVDVLLAGYGNEPVITSVSPAKGSSAGGTIVTIAGSNFSGASAVHFGPTGALAFTVNSATSISAEAPAGAGTVDVSVTGPGGTSAAVPADRFSYQATSLNAIACPPAGGDCLAAGVYSGTQSSVAQVARGKVVSNHSVPVGITLNGIACSAAGGCTAVGSTAAGTGVLVPVSAAGVPGTPESVPGTTALSGIACEPTGGCLAVGENGATTKEGVVVAVVSGVAGAPQAVPATTGLLAVACPADCVAVGEGSTTAVVVDVKGGTPSAPQDVANATTLQAIGCLGTTGPCEAVGGSGTRYFSSKAVSVEVVGGQAQFARVLPQASYLTGIACIINEYSCLVTGESASRGAVLTSTAGGSEPLPGTAQADAIACITPWTCEAVGLNAAFNGGIAVAVKRASIGEVNNANVNCEGSPDPKGYRYAAVSDHFQQTALPTGVRAYLSSAPVCRDATSEPLTSSWVMIEAGGASHAFFQAGVFYNPDGTDDPFVELEYNGTEGIPAYQSQIEHLENVNDGHIQFKTPSASYGIEIFNYGGVAGGTFAVQIKGETTSKTNKQCKWVEEVGKATNSVYQAIQGVPPGIPRLEVEGKFDGKCLWIGYLPAADKSELKAADLASEVHLHDDEVPGTYAKQLTFQKPEVLSGQTWTSFMPAVTSSDPVLAYDYETGCTNFMPTSGSKAAFRTWNTNVNGTCLPYRAGP